MNNKKSTTLKKILWILAVVLVLIQFYRPAKNISDKQSANAIQLHYNVPQNVGTLLRTSCYDCHSNNTKYPWYNNIEPVALWLNSHINDGKRHLNFDEFDTYSAEKKIKKLHEIAKTVEKDEMPLSSYTFIHGDALLSTENKKVLINWATALSKAQ
ncbi:heme-binding domain-containing protein [Asinibacterium sp. OR53]|uniref:heme-binding domain-containing protein n=1 Tax=Asinibacterium sp. OR53 TaxID=925409 RepID=UPI00047D9364|nr:heme-binding domain-containing protein [Asinibacterium sp. OR53]